ncbi:MAG: very short patch repair endonuclease [bacterium]
MDNLTPEQRTKNMRNIKSKDTIPEKIIARELKKQKIYFAKNVKTITGKPDFVFRRKHVAVFVDSDFWHGHPSRCVMPKSNCCYWDNKILKNRLRDRKVNKELKSQGWKVIRVWEYDVKKHLSISIKRILSAISKQDAS